jgi:hypothetical protein
MSCSETRISLRTSVLHRFSTVLKTPSIQVLATFVKKISWIYAETSAPRTLRGGTPRYAERSAPIPLGHRATKARINPGLY